jgi:hypothetical protein
MPQYVPGRAEYLFEQWRAYDNMDSGSGVFMASSRQKRTMNPKIESWGKVLLTKP